MLSRRRACRRFRRYDMHDLAPTMREVVNELRPLLPALYAKGCANTEIH
jgi:hypothetical protein